MNEKCKCGSDRLMSDKTAALLQTYDDLTLVNGRLVTRQRAESSTSLYGRFGLTPREARMADHVVQGLRNRAIAELENTTEQVVKNYLRIVYVKVGVTSRTQLAAVASRRVERRLVAA